VPRYIRFVTEYPLTVTGKVRKNEIRHISNEMLLLGKKGDFNEIVEIKKGKTK
jgi:acyl-coenzyme A synthetase/AMP-(fatty) acid ligase